LEILTGINKKEGIAPPSTTIDWAKLMQTLPKLQAPAPIVKKVVPPPKPMDKSAAKWILGTIAALVVIDTISKVKTDK
jgi:hypothetical protein